MKAPAAAVESGSGTAIQKNEPRTRVVICDDHRVVAQGLGRLLESVCDVRAVVHSGSALLSRLPSSDADCLLLDLQMPERNGLDLLPDIRRVQPAMKVIILTMHVDRIIADGCFSAGADGFVPKDAGVDEILFAIEEVLAGRRYLSPRVPKTTHRIGLAAEHLGFGPLTPRQQQIVLLLGQGKSPIEIAHALGLAPSTLTFHTHNLMRILGVGTEGALLRLAVLMTARAADPEEVASPVH